MSAFGFGDLAFLGAAGGVAAYDPDAQAYITAVETADGQALETAVRDAINAFVVGCKADGIWSAIKASCILAGARTLAGALVPLAGTAPTNFNFVSGDYNRKTGLVGDGNTKNLDSNRANNADPQSNNHNAVWLNSQVSNDQYVIDTDDNNTIGKNFLLARPNQAYFRNRWNFADVFVSATGSSFVGGIFGCSRSTSTSINYAFKQGSSLITGSASLVSSAPTSATCKIYGSLAKSNSRLAFYSIGESLDLALLDARVTTLINAIAAVIP